MFQLDGFINRFHTRIRRSLDFFARFVHEFLDNVSFHNRFHNRLFYFFVDVGDGLSTFDNLGWVYLVLLHKSIVIIPKVDSHWVFQFNSFLNWFYARIRRGFDCVTCLINEFLNDVSFHYRFFYFLVDVGNRLSTFDDLSRVNLILFHKGVIVVFKVDGSWVFQFNSFIDWFNTCICRGFDFFARFVHEFLDNVSFHNRFFNLTIDVGDSLGPFDNLGWVNLVLSHEGIIVIIKVDSGWMFQFDGFINWFYTCISRSLDFFASFVHEFLDNVSFHHWFFNLTIDVCDSLRSFDNFSRVNLVLSYEGIVIVFKVNGSWVFQLDSFINWFYSSICGGFDFFAGFIDEFLNHVSFWLYFLIEVGNGFTESIWNFSRIHLVLTDKLIGFSFELNGLRMRQAERFTNRFHTRIRLWGQFLVSAFFFEQLTNGTFRIG